MYAGTSPSRSRGVTYKGGSASIMVGVSPGGVLWWAASGVSFLGAFQLCPPISHSSSNTSGLANSPMTYRAGGWTTLCGCIMSSFCKLDIWSWLASSFVRRSVMASAVVSVRSPCKGPFAAAATSDVTIKTFGSTCAYMGSLLVFPRFRVWMWCVRRVNHSKSKPWTVLSPG